MHSSPRSVNAVHSKICVTTRAFAPINTPDLSLYFIGCSFSSSSVVKNIMRPGLAARMVFTWAG